MNLGSVRSAGLRSRHKPHPSCPDLIRASINLRNKFFKEDGSPGHLARRRASRFCPVMTISMGTTVCCGAATRPSQLEERRRTRPVIVETRRVARSSIRSVNLTIFWHCGTRHFSFRTAWERLPGNEPSMVLAEDAGPKGSGNADLQPNVRSSGESGQCRSS
jgi:hypothetical protein